MTPLTATIGHAAPAAGTPDMRACLERFVRWGAAPTVDGYCDLFTEDGTLLDADMEEPISGAAIRDSITRVLTLLPDFRFAPLRAVHDGPHAFVLASNSATLGERALAWEAVYALTVDGGRIRVGRRYYDQAALALGTETFADGAGDAAGEVATFAASAAGTLDLDARAVAWNRGDVAALVAPLGDVRLRIAGLAGPREGRAAVAAALRRFTARAEGLRVARGAVVATSDGTGIEWTGTVAAGGVRRRLSLVELLTPDGDRRDWRVLFNTLGL